MEDGKVVSRAWKSQGAPWAAESGSSKGRISAAAAFLSARDSDNKVRKRQLREKGGGEEARWKLIPVLKGT